jgi:hypothetical protein
LVINLNRDVGSESEFAVVSEGPILDFQFQIEWAALELGPIQGADERELGMMLCQGLMKLLNRTRWLHFSKTA